MISTISKAPVTTGPEWRAPKKLPTDLPQIDKNSALSPSPNDANEDAFLPRGWNFSEGQKIGRTGFKGLTGTQDLIVGPNTKSVRPGAVSYEGPVYALNYEKPIEAGLPTALAMAREIAKAADKADPTNTSSNFHSVAIVQAAFGHLALVPTGQMETNREGSDPLKPFILETGKNPTVVRPTDRAVIGIANATHWIDLRPKS